MDTSILLILLLIVIIVYGNNNPAMGDKIKIFYNKIYNAVIELVTPINDK